MINVNLDRRIRVHEGREGSTVNAPRRKVHWRGTLADYWSMHVYLSLADMQRLDTALDSDGFQNIGGSPAMLAYVVRVDGRA